MFLTLLFLLIAFLAVIGLMIIHEFGHFIVAKKFGVEVQEFGIGYPPRLFGKKIGDTLYSINLIPFGAFVRIKGETGTMEDYRSFSSLKMWQRVLIVLGGIIAFWMVAIFFFSIVFLTGLDLPVGDEDVKGLGSPYVEITAVFSNSPAQKSGLQRGDILKEIKVNESSFLVDKISDFQEMIRQNVDKEISLHILRNKQDIFLNVIPEISPLTNKGIIGVELVRKVKVIEKAPWYLFLIKGLFYTLEITGKIILGLGALINDLLSGKGVPREVQVAGPVGITVFLANAVNVGFSFFIYLLGLISTTVAFFNLLPIPALDGGKLIFLFIEKIKGKPVSIKVEQRITAMFFLILITFSIFVTLKFDIPRLVDFFKINF